MLAIYWVFVVAESLWTTKTISVSFCCLANWSGRNKATILTFLVAVICRRPIRMFSLRLMLIGYHWAPHDGKHLSHSSHWISYFLGARLEVLRKLSRSHKKVPTPPPTGVDEWPYWRSQEIITRSVISSSCNYKGKKWGQ